MYLVWIPAISSHHSTGLAVYFFAYFKFFHSGTIKGAIRPASTNSPKRIANQENCSTHAKTNSHVNQEPINPYTPHFFQYNNAVQEMQIPIPVNPLRNRNQAEKSDELLLRVTKNAPNESTTIKNPTKLQKSKRYVRLTRRFFDTSATLLASLTYLYSLNLTIWGKSILNHDLYL